MDQIKKRLTPAEKARILELLQRIERNTRGFDPMCNHGINHEHVKAAIAILTGQPDKSKM